MLTGDALRWFDDTPKRDLTEKVRRAIARYLQKYGHLPTLCFVHPSQAPESELSVAGVKVMPDKNVSLNNLWLGVEAAKHA